METYQAFGLTLQSELPLSCLRPAEAKEPDVKIGFGHVEEKSPECPIESGPNARCGLGRVWLRIPGVARFLITDGDSIRICPDPGADPQSLRLFVLGSYIGAILHQRECIVLHGSALRIGGHCVVFAGDSGAGKSTTAAVLHRRGIEILADDLSAVDDSGLVHPGVPQIKLWRDTVRNLGLDTVAMARIRPQADKYAYPVERGFCAASLPLAAVYVLNVNEGNAWRFEAVHGMGKLDLLARHTYRFEYIKGLGLQAGHMLRCSRLANQVRITKITRPFSGFDMEGLIERLESDSHTALASR